ncbi:phage tail protein [Plasticicumulans acidivorans]|uniref:Phage tail-like protein n=1 Tax=Plasticicumulans acidivorans TaxID=886464 RepID=A0A317N1I8_9GAMM|nr:phage tail protein [Plasticicumulans acidivorans]PWV65778.1 phage tail-like protein [Plasticicumulans acidivorans]
MPVFRETPYSAFNFLVEIEPGIGREVRAGFSDVAGLNNEMTVAEYRAGNSPVNHVQKLPGIYKAGDVTLKRGVIGAADLWEWITATREGHLDLAKRTVVISLLAENREDVVVRWKLQRAMPLKWTGPTLAGKGGGDVAIEELVLSVESLDQE